MAVCLFSLFCDCLNGKHGVADGDRNPSLSGEMGVVADLILSW